MDEPIFDAMLKTALEEALAEDMKELDAQTPVRQSRRQRQRMRKLLADPFGYERRLRTAPEKPARGRNHVRWAVIAAIVALLTGTAAGYTLGGGQFFQRMFHESPWAERYGGAADTEQLLELGGPAADTKGDDGLRLSVVDAVSDGQMAMVSVQMTVLEELEGVGPGSFHFQELDILPLDGREEADFGFGLSTQAWPDSEDTYLLIFSINDPALEQGGSYRIIMKDLAAFPGDGGNVLLPGTWELEVALQPAAVRTYSASQPILLGGESWSLTRAAVSPLAMTLELQGPETKIDMRNLDTLAAPVIHMAGGRDIGRDDCVCGITTWTGHIELTLEFQMPLDMEQIESVSVFGQELTAEP